MSEQMSPNRTQSGEILNY